MAQKGLQINLMKIFAGLQTLTLLIMQCQIFGVDQLWKRVRTSKAI